MYSVTVPHAFYLIEDQRPFSLLQQRVEANILS